MQNLKVYIADDHVLYRKAIVQLMSAFPRVAEIKEASNGNELLKLVKDDLPDVAILDLEMPVLNGTETCVKLVNEFPEVKIVVVSMHDSKVEICHLLELGAHAFLSKNAEVDEFESAIYAAADKGIYRNHIMRDALRNLPPSVRITVRLTAREHSVLKLICKGLTTKQISEQLDLSENTVRNHRIRIMKKVGAKNTSSLVKLVVQNGLLKE